MTRQLLSLLSVPTALVRNPSWKRGVRVATSTFSCPETSGSVSEAPAALSESPLLLLEGDEFYVSHDGVARTFYQLEKNSAVGGPSTTLAIEELYDLKHARKTFVVREEDDTVANDEPIQILSKQAQGVAPLGRPLVSIDIQEIDQGVFGSAGTGATTWEASIAMALFFTSHPNELKGNAVEIGCGVGMGGILTNLGPLLAGNTGHQADSVTLTDGNNEVLRECRHNIQRAYATLPRDSLPPIYVKQLDWNDSAESDDSMRSKYHTVIACDCAYLYTDVASLSYTMKNLLHKDGKIHMFGPYNRGAFHEVCKFLNEQLGLDVALEWIDLQRYRLKPGNPKQLDSWKDTAVDDCAFASKSLAQFLHVTASHKRKSQEKQGKDESLEAID